MKKYVKPVMTDVSLGKVQIDGVTHEVVGIVPFLAAAVSAVAAITKATELFDDHHLDYQHIESVDEVE